MFPDTLYTEAWLLVFYAKRAASWSSKTALLRPPLDDDGLRLSLRVISDWEHYLDVARSRFLGRLFLETNAYSSLVSRLPEARLLHMHNLEYLGPMQGSSHATMRSARTHNTPFVHVRDSSTGRKQSPFPTTSDRPNQYLYLWQSRPIHGPAEIFQPPQTTWRIHFCYIAD
jgi:hypothetical protein